MTTAFVARASRQTVILTAIAGLHLGAFVLIASGLGPGVLSVSPPDPPIKLILREVEPIQRVRPDQPDLIEDYFQPVPKPDDSLIPQIDGPSDEPPSKDDLRVLNAGGGVVVPPADYRPPALRTRDSRLAALINVCYPAAARRAGDEGHVVAKVAIDAAGKAAAWRVVESSGFPRLDSALDCVIKQIEFVAGRRDGRAVAAEALLPIDFRLD